MDLQEVALGMTCLCVRNTIIEDYHAAGKITDAEMKMFNKQVANKIYAALINMASPEAERKFAVMHLFETSRPYNWDSPELDTGIAKAVDQVLAELYAAREAVVLGRPRRKGTQE